MKEDGENEGYEGKGLRGPLYWLAAIQTYAAANNNGNGILGNLLGGQRPTGPDAPASREVMELSVKLAKVEAERHADNLNAAQAVWNARQEEKIKCQQRQLDQLFSLTKLTIPNGNLTPGVGPVAVVPVPPPAPAAPDITAIVNAVLAAQKASAAQQAA
jgi:hypothetical protein